MAIVIRRVRPRRRSTGRVSSSTMKDLVGAEPHEADHARVDEPRQAPIRDGLTVAQRQEKAVARRGLTGSGAADVGGTASAEVRGDEAAGGCGGVEAVEPEGTRIDRWPPAGDQGGHGLAHRRRQLEPVSAHAGGDPESCHW